MTEYTSITQYVNSFVDEINEREAERLADRLNELGWVKVVRCRDCKHYRDGVGENGRRYSEPYCGNVGELAYGALFEVANDWFCADGKRKKGK